MFDTPLRYPGGKGRLTQYVIDLIELNDLTGGHYVEPYAGGAGIAISLLYLEYASHIHLNDLNRSVWAFWRSVLDEPEALCGRIRDTPLTMDEWRRQKAVQTATDPTTLDLGFSTFFLNRTNRSGILAGGVIGGKDQTGPWKLDARFNRDELAKRVAKIATFGSRISLYNMDACDFVQGPLRALPMQTLIYLDPPYYVKGQKLYQNHYKPEDHAKIAGLVGDIKQPWIVSYDNAGEVRDLYARHPQQAFGLKYSAQSRYEGTEVMIFCQSLERPAAIEPFRGIAA